MSTHNICFYGEIRKIILELSSNTPPYQVPCIPYISTYFISNYCYLKPFKVFVPWEFEIMRVVCTIFWELECLFIHAALKACYLAKYRKDICLLYGSFMEVMCLAHYLWKL